MRLVNIRLVREEAYFLRGGNLYQLGIRRKPCSPLIHAINNTHRFAIAESYGLRPNHWRLEEDCFLTGTPFSQKPRYPHWDMEQGHSSRRSILSVQEQIQQYRFL